MSNREAIVSGDGWRAAYSLVTLYDQVIAAFPHRTKTADDATIGDAAHASRTSDHNPNSAGVVTALDLTHDPAGGFDSYAFGDMLKVNKDQRIKYVISNSRIFYGPRSPSHGANPDSQWKWEPYTGDNPHDQHIHISVGDSRYYDERELWNIVAAPQPPDAELPTLQRGSTGADVQTVQKILFVDGVFGPTTEQAVKDFQKAHGLTADGIVGRMTWAALLGTSGGVPAGDWQTNITSTVFGGASDPNRSAYDNHVITDTELGGSVPARVDGNRLVDIRDPVSGKIVTATLVDIGPWMVDDPYWQTGTRPIAEDMTQPLPRGPNKGRRSNGAGFDMTPATVRALGWNPDTGKWKIDWKFHTDMPSPTKEAAVTMISDAIREKPVAAVQPQGGGVMPTQEQIMSAIRWVLSIGGPFLVSHGYVTDSVWQQVAGAVIAIAPLIWAMATKTRSGLIATAAALPEVQKIIATPAIADGTLKADPKVVSR